jgi:hypothetical protein
MNNCLKKKATFGFAFVLCAFSNFLLATDHYAVYNSTDATSNIQAAINSASAGDRVIISYQGSGTKWISGPLQTKSNIELLLESGVILESKSGAFSDMYVPFILVQNQSNVTITGYGATVRMLLDEYSNGEWRHCIAIKSSNNITVKGLLLQKSGGDGIYLGVNGTPAYNDTVLVEDVTCDGNARQGISVISAKNLTINKCTLTNTGQYNPSGVAANGPWDGIDFEPNYTNEILENVTISNCTFKNNKAEAVRFALSNMNSISNYVSIDITGCDINDGIYGIYFAGNPQACTSNSFINVDDCVIADSELGGIRVRSWDYDSVKNSITDCYFINAAPNGNGVIWVTQSTTYTYKAGNLDLSNIHILESRTPYALKISGGSANYKIEDITGSIYSDLPDMSIYYSTGTYYDNITVSLYNLVVSFNNIFTSDIDGVGGTDSGAWLTDSTAKVYPGDYNGDGKTDLFVKGYDSYKALYLANSTGTGFTRAFLGNTGTVGGLDDGLWLTDSTANVYPGDYNGDGKTDLFVKGYGTYRGLYLANSNGDGFNCAFLSDQDQVGGTDYEPFFTDASANVYPGDYNGDGKTDIFIKGYGTYRGLYLANSTGTGFDREFLSDSDGVGGTDSENFLTRYDAIVYTGDYNGDGKTDLFVKGYGDYKVLYLANSTGTGFNRAFMGNSGTVGGLDEGSWLTDSSANVYTGDYNGDGKTDLFVKGYGTYRGLYLANANGDGFDKAFMSNLDQTGGTDSEPFFTDASANLYTGDYNGDGKTDLFIKGYYNYRALYVANSSGTTFTRVFMGYTNGLGGTSNGSELTSSDALVFPGDFDGDGRTDFFVKGYGTYRSLYTAGGNYQ